VRKGGSVRFYTTRDKRLLKCSRGKLSVLDEAVLQGCAGGLSIVRILKVGKPYLDRGSRQFATTDEVLASVDRLLRLKILERR